MTLEDLLKSHGVQAEDPKIAFARATSPSISTGGNVGMGIIVHVTNDDGSVSRYYATNTHNVLDRSNRLNGIKPPGDPRTFYRIYDENGNMAFAALSSFIDAQCKAGYTIGTATADSAVLKILSPDEVPEQLLEGYFPRVLSGMEEFTKHGWDARDLIDNPVPAFAAGARDAFAVRNFKGEQEITPIHAINYTADGSIFELTQPAGADEIRHGSSGGGAFLGENGRPFAQVFAEYSKSGITNYAVPITPIIEQVVAINLAEQATGKDVFVARGTECQTGFEWQDNLNELGYEAAIYTTDSVEPPKSPDGKPSGNLGELLQNNGAFSR